MFICAETQDEISIMCYKYYRGVSAGVHVNSTASRVVFLPRKKSWLEMTIKERKDIDSLLYTYSSLVVRLHDNTAAVKFDTNIVHQCSHPWPSIARELETRESCNIVSMCSVQWSCLKWFPLECYRFCNNYFKVNIILLKVQVILSKHITFAHM